MAGNINANTPITTTWHTGSIPHMPTTSNPNLPPASANGMFSGGYFSPLVSANTAMIGGPTPGMVPFAGVNPGVNAGGPSGTTPSYPSYVTPGTSVPAPTTPPTSPSKPTTTTPPAGGPDDHCAEPSKPPVSGGGGHVAGGGANSPKNTNQKLNFNVSGAKFTFPSLSQSAKSPKAPEVQWGPGWKRVEGGGPLGYHMEHENGSKAVPGIQPRMSIRPRNKAPLVDTQYGKGRQFPDGTILGFDDKTSKPFIIDPHGARRDIGFGTHTFGGVKVRLFEARTVSVTRPDGVRLRYDSRGNMRFPQGTNAGAAGGGAGASQVGKGGGPSPLQPQIDALRAAVQQLIQQLAANGADPALIAQAQSVLSSLPSGAVQAAGGAAACGDHDAMHGGATGGETTTPPPAGSGTVGNGAQPTAPMDHHH